MRFGLCVRRCVCSRATCGQCLLFSLGVLYLSFSVLYFKYVPLFVQCAMVSPFFPSGTSVDEGFMCATMSPISLHHQPGQSISSFSITKNATILDVIISPAILNINTRRAATRSGNFGLPALDGRSKQKRSQRIVYHPVFRTIHDTRKLFVASGEFGALMYP